MESSPQHYKILLVDDDPFITEMYMLKFKESGFDIESAHDGKEALQKIKDHRPDMVLLDVVMPTMDGFAVLEALKQDVGGKTCKIILLTNLGQKSDVDRGMRLGADDYLIKAHFTPGEVVQKVKTMLGR